MRASIKNQMRTNILEALVPRLGFDHQPRIANYDKELVPTRFELEFRNSDPVDRLVVQLLCWIGASTVSFLGGPQTVAIQRRNYCLNCCNEPRQSHLLARSS